MVWYWQVSELHRVTKQLADPTPVIVGRSVPSGAYRGQTVNVSVDVRNDGDDGYIGASFLVTDPENPGVTLAWGEAFSFIYNSDQDTYFFSFVMPNVPVDVEIAVWFWRDGVPTAGPISWGP